MQNIYLKKTPRVLWAKPLRNSLETQQPPGYHRGKATMKDGKYRASYALNDTGELP